MLFDQIAVFEDRKLCPMNKLVRKVFVFHGCNCNDPRPEILHVLLNLKASAKFTCDPETVQKK